MMTKPGGGDLFTEIEQETKKRRPGPRCKVAHIYDALSPADRDGLDRAFKTATITAAAIANRLQARGYDISENGIAHHRRGGCACGRTV